MLHFEVNGKHTRHLIYTLVIDAVINISHNSHTMLQTNQLKGVCDVSKYFSD